MDFNLITNKAFILGVFLGITLSCAFVYALVNSQRKKHQQQTQLLVNELSTLQSAMAASEQARVALEQEQQESQDLLEDKVQERTLELNIALQELEEVNHELEQKNTLDELTGLFNRRFYDQKIMAEYRRSRRNLTPLSLIIIDIDHFKNVNDTYGHLAGDQCLMWLSEQIKKSLKRSADMAFRYGGEEFCLILPDTDSQGAIGLAELLRKSVAKQQCMYNNIHIPLTLSCGVTTYSQQDQALPEQLFACADKALYQAKDSGRNQSILINL